jgi:anthranilate/para-aminobenzoate synthase component I
MSWKLLAAHPWQEPLAFAAHFDGDLALLYSSRREAFSGTTSFLFLEPAFHATGTHWRDVPPSEDNAQGLPDWVGYFGYAMGHQHATIAAPITLPDFWISRYQRLFRFNHDAQSIDEFGRFDATESILPLEGGGRSAGSGGGATLPPHSSAAPPSQPSPLQGEGVIELTSNMRRSEYEAAVRATVSAIEEGDFYQANITRKFFGRFEQSADGLDIFTKLCTQSPSPYSAFIRHGRIAIVSSSPESFLHVDANRILTSRPIKGSIRRGNNEAEDKAFAKALSLSSKNLAENLMIVDLMRHDLAQVSEVGSVAVVEQSALYTYATIHHLVSTVRATMRKEFNAYDAVRACFPPGSMTGAPKQAAIQWCASQEKMARGVYSGAIGWIAGNRCDLSVVIRTLILEGERFEFQVGGGIVADSDAQDEWHETLTKARGIAAALGINEAELEAL